MESAVKSVGYRIVSCRECSYENKLRPDEIITGEAISFQFGCRINLEDANRVSIAIMSTIFYKGEVALKLESETVFEFSPFDAAFDTSDDGQIVDRIGIMPTLIGLSYSSTRGMIAIRSAGTSLAAFPLPIVDAVDLTNKMMRQQNSCK